MCAGRANIPCSTSAYSMWTGQTSYTPQPRDTLTALDVFDMTVERLVRLLQQTATFIASMDIFIWCNNTTTVVSWKYAYGDCYCALIRAQVW